MGIIEQLNASVLNHSSLQFEICCYMKTVSTLSTFVMYNVYLYIIYTALCIHGIMFRRVCPSAFAILSENDQFRLDSKVA